MTTKEEVLEQFRVQSICEAATRVIARKGIAASSMQEIAEEAGVAKGTLYLYFKNQQELLEAVIDRALEGLRPTLESALASEGGLESRLRLLVRAELEFFSDNFHLFQIHFSTKYPEGADSQRTRCARVSKSRYQSHIDRLSGFFVEAMKQGEVRVVDARRLALFVQEGIIGVLFHRMTETDPPPMDDEVEWIVTMILTGIALGRRSRRRT